MISHVFMRSKVILIIFMCVFMASCSGPSALMRVHAYDGPENGADEIATVFAVWGGFAGERTTICSVDGVNYWKMGLYSDCPSVVYVKPGEHKISVKYNYANYYGNIELDINVASGRVYKIEARSLDGLKTATYEIVEMPLGFELRYKDIMPIPLKEKFIAEGEQLVLPADANY